MIESTLSLAPSYQVLYSITKKERVKTVLNLFFPPIYQVKGLSWMILLLLLSRFSRVRLCATPETAAHQAPPSLGFYRQEHWSGLPFPSPMHESET